MSTQRQLDGDAERFRVALEAEVRVSEELAKIGFPKTHIHLRRRVYVEEDRRAREIDLILVTDRCIYVIEVKHWAGDVWNSGRYYYQMPPVRNGVAITYEDPFEELKHKTKGLNTYLRRNRITLPGAAREDVGCAALVPFLVFTHPSVRLDPASLGKHPGVMKLDGLVQRIAAERSSATWRAVQWCAPVVSSWTGYVTWHQQTEVNTVLGRTRTWDCVTQHNGAVLNGDVQRVVLLDQGLTIHQTEMKGCTVQWSSASWYGAVAALWSGKAGEMLIQLHPPRGRLGGTGARGAAAARSSTPPTGRRISVLLVSQAVRDPSTVNHLVIKPAGQPHTVCVPLGSITKLEYRTHEE